MEEILTFLVYVSILGHKYCTGKMHLQLYTFHYNKFKHIFNFGTRRQNFSYRHWNATDGIESLFFEVVTFDFNKTTKKLS